MQTIPEAPQYYYVGKNIAETPQGVVSEIIGTFSSEDKTIKACISDDYFICPLALDMAAPDETVKCKGFRYPHISTSPSA